MPSQLAQGRLPMIRYKTFLAMTAALLLATPAIAGSTGQSSGDLTFQKSERVNSVRGAAKIVTRTVSGISHARDKGGPLDGAEFRCHMTLVVRQAAKEPAKGSGYCIGIAPRGDTWELLLSGSEFGGTWKFIDGTGQYKDIQGSGDWTHKGSQQAKNERYEWSGRWALKD